PRVLHAVCHVFRHGVADEVFTDTRRRECTNGVVGVYACADDGRVAHAAGDFRTEAAGRGRGGQMTAAIQDYGSDGAVRRVLLAAAGILEIRLFDQLPAEPAHVFLAAIA